LALEVPDDRVGAITNRLRRRPVHVDRRSVVRVDAEQSVVAELRLDHPAQVAVDFADTGVVATNIDAVASRGRRLVADEMVALVDREHEQRVRLVDPVRGEAVEELLEGEVVVLQLLDVTVLAGDRKSTRLNSSHRTSSYAVFCLKKKMQ